MWAIKVAFALSLGVTGIIGCASSERLYDRTTTSTIPIPQTSSPAANLADSASAATSLESSAHDTQQPAIRAPNPLAQTREAPPTAQFKPIGPQPERVTSEGKTAQPIKSAPPSAQPARQPATEPRDPHRRARPDQPRHARPRLLPAKQADGKSRKEAMRCLKRRISDAVYRQLRSDLDA